MKAKWNKILSVAVSLLVLVTFIVADVICGIYADIITEWVCGFSTGAEENPVARAEGEALARQIQGEGSILVQNNENLLPLDKEEITTVNVFGWATTAWVYGGSGSGQVVNTKYDLLGALDEYGISYNTDLTNMYEKFQSDYQYNDALHSLNNEYSRLYEPNIDDDQFYTAKLKQEALEFSDTALVVISRRSGESNDLPKVQYKKNSSSSRIIEDSTRTYLEISAEEEALLQYVGDNYKNVIVLINSTNVMELGFMETIETQYGLDACLIVGTTGTHGASEIPAILYGEKEVDILDEDGDPTGETETVSVSPSGKTADTYAYDLSTSSTYVDTGSGLETVSNYTNGNGLYPTTVSYANGNYSKKLGVSYTDYREGIYVGYKWYETADAEGFWDSSYAKNKWGISNGYEDVVQYPFGHGKSYTEFEWEIYNVNHKNNASLNKDDVIQISVTVTNVGEYVGQDVVQVYYSYAEEFKANDIEKSAVNLAAFAKTTNVLEPGESQSLTLEFNVEDMKSYDYEEKKVANGGYIVEQGEYAITLRTDAHTLADDKIVDNGDAAHESATLIYNINSDIIYNLDSATQNEVKNLFTGENAVDGVALDGNSDGSANITYLSRANFENTFPAELSAPRAMTQEMKDLNLYTREMAEDWIDENSKPVTMGDSSKGDNVVETVKEGNSEYLKLTETGRKLGKDYNAEEWDAVLDRITYEEMESLVLNGYVKTGKIDSIGKPATRDYDGPNQLCSFGGLGAGEETIGFSTIVLAQTWNETLAYSMGLNVGNEGARYGVNGWYGPGINLHRSPFAGRNFEYYSEDSLLTGVMCVNTIKAARNKGMFSYVKHLCLYETESCRDGMYVWTTEQALREIYLKPFEMAVKEGGATGFMTSYGRIGAVWTGGSKALLKDLVETEWGFRGAYLTDYSDHPDKMMNADHMLRSGGDLFMNLAGGSFKYEKESNTFKQALRESTHDVVYMWLNALVTNEEYNQKIEDGLITDDVVTVTAIPKLNFPWWIPLLAGVEIIAMGGLGFWVFYSFKKKKLMQATETTEPIETIES